MALSVRTRFEVFKRDEFTCRYCGKKSPDVVLEVDHIVPKCDGGSDDPMNLATSCWACNSGKSGVPLGQLMTGEDPHDKAVLLLEQDRQLREYNAVLASIRKVREVEADELADFWESLSGRDIYQVDLNWITSALSYCPFETIRQFMLIAAGKRMTKSLKYVGGCVRNWRYEHAAEEDTRGRANG